jgi:hypothetical protein
MGKESPLQNRRKADDSYRVMSGGGSLKPAPQLSPVPDVTRAVAASHKERASAMKTFASPSFFRTFDLLLSTTNPGKDHLRWSFDGVEWERERHSFAGPNYSVALEVFALTHPGRDGWRLIVIKEFWWAGTKKDALKSLRWARPLGGRTSNAIAWFRRQQVALEREPEPINRLTTSR